MTTAEIVRAQIRKRAISFSPVKARAARKKRSPEELRATELRAARNRHLRAWMTPYRDLR
jgi:hypothetical protein